jgi:hypothetical protein
MGSTARTATNLTVETAGLRWRSWPLKDQYKTSWLAVVGMLGIAGAVWYVGGGLLLAVAAFAGMAGTLWQFLLPVTYEIDSLGLRRHAMGRSRLIPWHAVRAYQLRLTGVLLYRQAEPGMVDLLRSFFVPYPADEDSMVCALREHVPHATQAAMARQ